MAQRQQSSDDIADQIKKQQDMYDNADPDGSDEPVDIDKAVEDVTGNVPDADSETDFLSKQINDDDKKHGDVPPDGSDADQV